MANNRNISEEKEPVEKYVNNVETNSIDERINRLYGLSSDKQEKQTRQYDPKELVEVRKKLVYLLGGIILLGLAALFILISPIFNNKNNNLSSDVNNENNVDNNLEEKEEENKYIGQLNINDELIEKLNSTVSFTTDDFKHIDLFSLYDKETIEFTNIPNDIKLYLLKKDTKFLELLVNNGIEEYLDTCNPSGIIISKNIFDELVKKVFGANIKVDYKDINYIYEGDKSSKKITLSYNLDNYIVKCNDYLINDNITKYIQQELIKAVGHEDSIELYQKVVFISEKGVFKDPNMQILITNDRNDTFKEYISKGNTYKYTFSKQVEGYYLSKIELVKEDN